MGTGKSQARNIKELKEQFELHTSKTLQLVNFKTNRFSRDQEEKDPILKLTDMKGGRRTTQNGTESTSNKRFIQTRMAPAKSYKH
jgi:hypothetical protein